MTPGFPDRLVSRRLGAVGRHAARGALAVFLTAACGRPLEPAAPELPSALAAFERISGKPQACSFSMVRLEGTATNLKANASTGVTMQILCRSGLLRAEGRYDARRLFGRFDIDGTFAAICPGEGSPREGALCMGFEGDLLLGDDGSGFPSGTRAKYAMTISLASGSAGGRYEVAPIPGWTREPQPGVLELRVVERQ